MLRADCQKLPACLKDNAERPHYYRVRYRVAWTAWEGERGRSASRAEKNSVNAVNFQLAYATRVPSARVRGHHRSNPPFAGRCWKSAHTGLYPSSQTRDLVTYSRTSVFARSSARASPGGKISPALFGPGSQERRLQQNHLLLAVQPTLRKP